VNRIEIALEHYKKLAPAAAPKAPAASKAPAATKAPAASKAPAAPDKETGK
jgi:hypothetical protein